MEKYSDKNRGMAVQNLTKQLYSDEIKQKLVESKAKVDYRFEAALLMAVKLEAGKLFTNLAIHQKSAKKHDYLKEIRERLMILNNKKLQDVKCDLFLGLITPEEFANRDAHEFEPEDVRKRLQSGREWYMQSLQSDFYLKNTNCKEGEFMCFKCKGRKVMTTQKQMRCADEPMTTQTVVYRIGFASA